MADVFHLPAVGDTMVEGTIIEWFVDVGDPVNLDQAICSVETDKSVVELTTPFRGTVLQLGGAPGEVIEVGAPLLVVGQPGEEPPYPGPGPDPDQGGAGRGTATVAAPVDGGGQGMTSPGVVLSPVLRRLAIDLGVDISSVAGGGVGGRITRDDIETAASRAAGPGPVLAMPKVRRAAREGGIDLRTVARTGPRGSVTMADLDRARSEARAATTTRSGPSQPTERRQRLSAMRRSIAAHLTESVQTVPQFTAMVDVEVSSLLDTRQALARRLGRPLPLDALLVALLLPVLRDHPVTNATLDGDEIVFFEHHDIGIAVDTPDGLMVPVVRGAGRRSTLELATEIVRLATAARERTIRPDEMTGATCTVNNVGAVGIEAGTPILPLGTSTILAFGRARPRVALRNGNAVEVPTMTISGTFDHRLIDGGDAGRFLTQLREHIEVPAIGLL